VKSAVLQAVSSKIPLGFANIDPAPSFLGPQKFTQALDNRDSLLIRIAFVTHS
jgi:hypothetical protein